MAPKKHEPPPPPPEDINPFGVFVSVTIPAATVVLVRLSEKLSVDVQAPLGRAPHRRYGSYIGPWISSRRIFQRMQLRIRRLSGKPISRSTSPDATCPGPRRRLLPQKATSINTVSSSISGALAGKMACCS